MLCARTHSWLDNQNAFGASFGTAWVEASATTPHYILRSPYSPTRCLTPYIPIYIYSYITISHLPVTPANINAFAETLAPLTIYFKQRICHLQTSPPCQVAHSPMKWTNQSNQSALAGTQQNVWTLRACDSNRPA
eukprot:366221-Chlamydomonas_euryale.AAC.12